MEKEENHDSFKADSDGEIDEEAMREADKNELWFMVEDVFTAYEDIVFADDKDECLKLVRDHGYFGIKGYFRPSRFSIICESSAVNIAKALLQGESGWKVSLNSMEDGVYPLHAAATSFCCELLELLITHGARTDIRTEGPMVLEGLLPLNVAVEDTWCIPLATYLYFMFLFSILTLQKSTSLLALVYSNGSMSVSCCRSHHKYFECWTYRDSALKLMVLLSLPEMKMFLDSISLLAQHTRQTFDELLNYIEQGKLLQMAVLFTAASKQIMATTCQDKDGRSISAMEVILRQIDGALIFLINEAEEIPNKPKNGLSVNKCKVKLKTMASARLICQLIGKIGNSLDEFRQTLHSGVSHKEVVEYIRSLFAREGFLLNEKDIDLSNLDWYRYLTDKMIPTPELSERSASLYPPQPDRYDLVHQPYISSIDNIKVPTTKILQHLHVKRFIQSSNSVTSIKSFAAQPIYADGLIMGCRVSNKDWGKKKAKQAVRPLSQVEPRMKGIVHPMPIYQPSRPYSTIASLILRLTRRI